MGTRHLTMVYLDGEYKIAQYGQWDGYPDYTGVRILRFLRDTMQREVFERNIRATQALTEQQVEDIKKMFRKKHESGMTWTEYNVFTLEYPSLSRDTGSEILEILQNSKSGVVPVYKDLNFAADSLFCEWGYVVDLDNNTFEVFRGFNKTPLDPSDRFYFLRDYERKPEYIGDNPYRAIKLVKSWKLDDLPSDDDFMDTFESDA